MKTLASTNTSVESENYRIESFILMFLSSK